MTLQVVLLALRSASKYALTKPAFLLYGIVLGALGHQWLGRELAAPKGVVQIARTKRIVTEKVVTVTVPVKVPVISDKTAKGIGKDYGVTVHVPKDGDTSIPDGKVIVTDEKQTKDLPEGSTVKAASTIDSKGNAEAQIVVTVPRFSWKQRFGLGIGAMFPSVLDSSAEESFVPTGYLLWKPASSPRYRMDLRVTLGAADLKRIDETKELKVVLEKTF